MREDLQAWLGDHTKGAVVQKLVVAVKTLFASQTPVANQARWGQTPRSAAGLALLLVVHNIGKKALEVGFAKPSRKVPATENGDPERELSFAEIQSRRLAALRGQWDNPATVAKYLLVVIGTDPVRHLLCQVFRHDATVYPDLQAYADRQGHCCGSPTPHTNLVQQLVSGELVGTCLKDGCNMLASAAIPLHVQAVRDRAAAAMGLPAAVTCFRQVLLPGLAQLWFRASYVYTETWPWKLLQLLPGTPSARRTVVAEDFLSACPDCLDRGLSLPLRTQLSAAHHQLSRKQFAHLVANVEDETLGLVLRQLQTDAEASIMDIECRHARNRRAERGGRPPDFASMAARCFLRECTLLHAQVTGHLPEHHHRARVMQAKRAVGLTDPDRCKRAVANPFFAFRHEREAAWKAACRGSTSGPGPRTREWEQQVAKEWKDLKEMMPERQLAYTVRAKERKAALAGQPPWKRRRRAGPPVATADTIAALTDIATPGPVVLRRT